MIAGILCLIYVAMGLWVAGITFLVCPDLDDEDYSLIGAAWLFFFLGIIGYALGYVVYEFGKFLLAMIAAIVMYVIDFYDFLRNMKVEFYW